MEQESLSPLCSANRGCPTLSSQTRLPPLQAGAGVLVDLELSAGQEQSEQCWRP